MSEIKEIIEKRIEKLPTDIVAALKTFPWVEKMKEISRTYILDKDKIPLFEMETIMTVLGFEAPKNYPENLSAKVGLDDDTAISVAKAVDERIIKPITEEVEKNKKEEPVVITQENKEEAMKRLMERQPKQEPQLTINNEQLTKEIYPMIEEGEIVHDVPHAESTIDNKQTTKEPQKATAQIPVNEPLKEEAPTQPSGPKYPDGKDPYREPLI